LRTHENCCFCVPHCLHLSVTAAGFAERISGLEKRDLSGSRTSESRSRKNQKEPSRVYVRRALGRLSVDVCASSEIYEAYFHIPIAFSEDGEKFDFLCSYMGGVSDDPLIPDVGGWTKMVLDLTPYAGEMVQIRFHFESDDQEVPYGAYIDDVHVYGRARGETSTGSRNPSPPVADFDLQQNYPNPFNTETVITYHLAKSAQVDLAVFNTLEQKVRSLVDGSIQAGECRIVWRGDDENGAQVSSGIYFYRLQVGERSRMGKLLLLR
jgi:hypothetical protein